MSADREHQSLAAAFRSFDKQIEEAKAYVNEAKVHFEETEVKLEKSREILINKSGS
jgi:hypothetical protein